MQSLSEPVAVELEAFAERHVPAIVAATLAWETFGSFGPPFWRPRSESEIRRKIQSQAGPGLAPEYNFVVVQDGRYVGECSIHALDYRNRVAQVGVCVWDQADRGAGLGSAATRSILNWATGYLGLRRVEAWIVASNSPSRRLFETLGFRHEGTLRERVLMDGAFVDICVYGYIANGSPIPHS